ncbi:MAG: molybdopterin molybdotransferase MoeA [Chloroflexi bacterium]|nr:molybdopterin molybdotransferase MoeA [Chloroflexota bacterium]
MISVDEARERILSMVSPLDVEERPLLTLLGHTLAEDVRATFNIPPHDNAAMDGYAVRDADIAGASSATPRTLRVIGEVAAGQAPAVAVASGVAVRIMTGAPLPEGTETVVPFELTREMLDTPTRGSGQVAVCGAPPPGANIRCAGEDVQVGETILRAGTELRPAEIGVLASLGLAKARVVRRPRVAILSTGDELLPPGEPLAPGKIYDANTYALATLVQRYGGVPVVLGIAHDQIDDLRAKVRLGLDADLLMTSAGVSKGNYDMVKDVLAAEGEIAFWQVAMKPGRPLAFGRIGAVPHIGLPGNPVASMIAFEQFARPALLKMQGKSRLRKPEVPAVFHGEASNRDGRRCFLRVRVELRDGEYQATLAGAQGSGILSSMALANGLAVIPEHIRHVTPGDRLSVQMVDWPEE